MTHPKILLTGASGYIGGTVLSQLLSSPDTSKYVPITCLVRGEERQKTLIDKFGDKVNPVLFKDFDEADLLIELASHYDIIVNTAIGFHPTYPRNLVKGLAKRKAETGKDVWIISTSGTSNLGDRPISKKYVESDPNREFSDKDDIYSYEKKRAAEQPYPQRDTELSFIDAGLEFGVKTLVIMSGLIYGIGTGEFNKLTIQIPTLLRTTIEKGYSIKVEEGAGVWDHVHVTDLAKLYQIVLDKILDGGDGVPFGKKGIIFSGAGRHSWGEAAQAVADAVFKEGKIRSNEVKSVSLEEGAKILAGGLELFTELGFCSNSRTIADVGKDLGWKPEKGVEDWNAHFEEELKFITLTGSTDNAFQNLLK